ncbi:MAG TPA: hypothetical protein VFN87_03945 [Solirubrobacteraceae bacterium]|nr:hypothetical protein [Solirubrobacteraceae bacterium]
MRPILIHPHRDRRGLAARAAVVPAVLTLAVAGCGSTGNTTAGKPSYCTARSNLEQSVKALPQTDVLKNGTKALEANLEKVVNDAKALKNAVKTDFASETKAIDTAMNALTTTLHQIQSQGPTAANLTALPGQISAVASSVKSFTSATASKCS